jgi:hypothetical protein
MPRAPPITMATLSLSNIDFLLYEIFNLKYENPLSHRGRGI